MKQMYKTNHKRCYLLLVMASLMACSSYAENNMITQTRQQQQAIRDKVMTLTNGLYSRQEAEDAQSIATDDIPTTISNPDIQAVLADSRDPFAVPQRLLDSLMNRQTLKNQGVGQLNYAFSRQSVNKMPEIKLKGVMRRAGQKSPIAVVLLNNETYMVRENDEIGFNPVNPAQVIKIVKINRLSLLVEVGTLGELVVVR